MTCARCCRRWARFRQSRESARSKPAEKTGDGNGIQTRQRIDSRVCWRFARVCTLRRGLGQRQGGHRQRKQRRRVFRRRQEGLFQAGRHQCFLYRVRFGRANGCSARYRPAGRRSGFCLGRVVQRGRARHRHQDRRRQGFHPARLWLPAAVSTKGSRRQRAL